MDTTAETLNSESATSAESTDVESPGSSAPTEQTDVTASSPEGVKEPASIAEALEKVVLEEPAEETATGEQAGEQAEESPTTGTETGEAEADGAEGKQDEQPEATAEADGSLNVPYAKRPEWQAMMKLAGENKSEAAKHLRPLFEREHKLTQQIEAMKPQADLVREFKTYAGDEAGFNTMRHIVKAYATDPAASVPILEQMLTDARQRAGLVVTDDDIKQRVNDGLLDEATATELQQSRIKAKQAEDQRRRDEQNRQTAEQTQAKQATANALNAWEEQTRGRDPDFGNVTELNDPEHGKSVADQVFDALTLKVTANPNLTAADLVAEANRVHRLAKSRIGTSRPKPKPVVTSQGSSITSKPKPMSVRQAMDAVRLT